jgi:hypothetical protein
MAREPVRRVEVPPPEHHPEAAVVMPRTPLPGSTWTLRDVLPQAGAEYRATVERVWRDETGRLLAQLATDDGPRLVEVWLQRWEESYEAGRA